MTENFKVLSDEEFDKLKDAISLITVYIAGADGKIETNELEWARKVTDIRGYTLPGALKNFYAEVGEDFEERVKNYVQTLDSIDVRNATAAKKLSELNPIMAKLPAKIGAALYKSYISFAEHVAKSSGGFLGFFSVGPEEKAILGLKMITPIEYEEDDIPQVPE